ncbi:MAG: di-trans,poly-cis-decaprenylcistransferase [Candidatus Woykebacteria bacterium GWB1_45_5]|uniref:Isoprenyl transferase n=2 Tax=Candidatus Woykeibacteriota TaxID=1817899 RepID=A0A1G1W536_9BACT|nr:MAG: di-trans,poly-cis-decaprenylcistransferase [Candidatus Woykebacteria bacterium GWA1_44_8]OGY23716.1 MAG: di-trans,poly-cis-decaprenylcistransferase [Candidatus Woykebacteria bacterium GWB1_45_5]
MNKYSPCHVAIIMDGNRRWAADRGLSTNKGHQAGADTLEAVVKTAIKFGIKYLTVYALSAENLRGRSRLEISFLFSLLEKGVKERLSTLEENGVQVRYIGDLTALPVNVQNALTQAEQKLSKNKRLTLIIALNYGGRKEIVQAVRNIKKKINKISEGDIANNLYTVGIPDPDLIIRTGGQMRLSNFLLWQSSYSELYFTDTLWPDFSEKEFMLALESYSQRVRNFGR